MIPFYLVALFAHYMADFPGQAFFQKYMGKKNESKAHLTNHVFMYASIMLLVCMWFHLTFLMLAWVGLNAALHWLIDYWTSKGSHHCWNHKKVPAFWCVIGFDQMLHMMFMFYSGYALELF